MLFKIQKIKVLVLVFAIISIVFRSYAQQWTSINSLKATDNNISLIESSEEETVLQIDINAYAIKTFHTPNGIKKVVTIKDGVQLQQKGKPDLPVLSQPLLIPDDKKMGVRILDADYFDIPNMEIAPSKGAIKRTVLPNVIPYSYGEVYQQNAFFPQQNAWMSKPYILRNTRGTVLKIAPVQYNPITKVLRVYSSLKVKVFSTNRPAEINPIIRSNSSKSSEFQDIYKRRFINYEQMQNTVLRYEQLKEGNPGRMLIISHGEYLDIMQPLVDWKNQKGIHTEMFDVAAIGDSMAIKNFIKNYYNAHPDFIYLLLVGNIDQVQPSHTIPDAWGESYGGNCDNAYTYLVGDDHYADIFIGRFAGETASDIATQVERTIHYERDIQASEIWMTNALCSASNEDGTAYGVIGDDGESDSLHLENIKIDLQNFGYFTHSENQNGGTSSGLQNYWSTGCGQFQYTGHGSNLGVGNVPFQIDRVYNLTNVNRLPFVMTVGCSTGNYFASPNYALSQMTATQNGLPVGAIGTAASIISQAWASPMDAQDEVVDLITEQHPDNVKRTLGGVLFNGFFHMLDEYNTPGESTTPGLTDGEEMADYWLVYGDPSVLLRTQLQEEMTVSHPEGISTGAREFTVHCNVEGALVSLTFNNEIQGIGFIDNGQVILQIDEVTQTSGSMLVTITSPNKVTYQREIYINTATAPLADFDANAIQIEIGQRVVFYNKSSNAPNTLNWSFEGGFPALSTANNPSVKYDTQGTYTVELTVSNTAGSDTKTRTAYITVSDPSLCDLSIMETTQTEYIKRVTLNEIDNSSGIGSGYSDYTDLKANLEAGQTYTMFLEMECNPDYFTYQTLVWIDWNENGSFYDENEFIYGTEWNGDASVVLTEDTVKITVPETVEKGQKRMRILYQDRTEATYLPCGEVYYGEVEDYTINIGVALATDFPTKSNLDVKIYPNPTSGQINVLFSENRDRQIKVFNMLGEMVWQKAINGNHTTMDLSNLPDGTYLIGLRDGDKMVTKKLVLQR